MEKVQNRCFTQWYCGDFCDTAKLKPKIWKGRPDGLTSWKRVSTHLMTLSFQLFFKGRDQWILVTSGIRVLTGGYPGTHYICQVRGFCSKGTVSREQFGDDFCQNTGRRTGFTIFLSTKIMLRFYKVSCSLHTCKWNTFSDLSDLDFDTHAILECVTESRHTLAVQ